MAYYNGTANDLTALRQALIDSCVLEGWAWDGGNEVLSQGALFLQLQVVSGYLSLLGRTAATTGDMPGVVRIGQIGSTPLAFPIAFEIFVFSGEVYMVVNYGVNYYQWCAFGGSTVQGLPGSGMWVGASMGSQNPSSGIDIRNESGGLGLSTTSAALFWGTDGTAPSNRNGWLHSDIDGQGWWLSTALHEGTVGVKSVVPLIGILPNSWNSEAVLLPLRAFKARGSFKISLTADLEHARHTRVDNYQPGQIVTLGSDRWKIFPWYRKDTTTRNGGGGINHTGTFGWAIRYEGP